MSLKRINKELKDLTEDSGMDLARIGNYLSNVFQRKTKIGKNWVNFGPENALEHIKEYTNFYGQRPSLKMPPLPKGKVEVDKEEKVKVKKETKKARILRIPNVTLTLRSAKKTLTGGSISLSG